MIGFHLKEKRECITCKKKYSPTSPMQKYCCPEHSPFYKKPKDKSNTNFEFSKKYPKEIIIENIQRFYRLQDLTIPIRIFRHHPFIRLAILSEDEQDRLYCNRWAVKNINIPKDCLCEICKNKKATLRHHPDYSKPLFIRFLCHSCHVKIHKSKDFKFSYS